MKSQTHISESRHLIAVLTGDSEVTNQEAAEVIAWIRDWANDTFASQAEEVAKVSDHYLLHKSNREIIGGLSFVLADVRRCSVPANLQNDQMAKFEREAGFEEWNK